MLFTQCVRNIVLDCADFNVRRKLFKEVNSLKEFSIILPENVLEFVSYFKCKKYCVI